VNFPKGTGGGVSWRDSAQVLAPLLLATLLATNVGRAQQPAAPEAWSAEGIEAAFHDVLAHGDLSDIGFLARTLGLDLKVVQWDSRAGARGELVNSQAIPTRVPSYLHAYHMSYQLTRNTQDGTTRIEFNFGMNSCPDLAPWGKDWSQTVDASVSVPSDDGPIVYSEAIDWQQDPDGVRLERRAADLCEFSLWQSRHAALSVPQPSVTTPGPGTELLDRFIDLVVAGDLRDYLRSARILGTEFSVDGKLRERRLWLFVDISADCIAPGSLEARMLQRHIRFRKKSDGDSGASLQTLQRGNAFSVGYLLQDSCVEMFGIDQVTNVY
jgi:hypothetical protein